MTSMHIDGSIPGLTSAGEPIQAAGLAVRLVAGNLPLTVGQEVVARVVQQLPGGHVLIDVKGVPLDASAPPGLQPGTEVPLRVAQLEPQVVFHIVEQSPSIESQAAQVVRVNLADR